MKFRGFVFGADVPLDSGFSFGGGGGFDPISLSPKLFVDVSDTSTLFQDAVGTTPVTTAGDPVGRVLDLSGNGNHLTAPSDAARPVYAVSESGNKLLQSDEVDDELSVTLPDLGTDVTIAYTTQSELRINEGETVGAGEYTLPQVDLLNYLMIDRQLTKSEKIELIRYLSRSAEGVNYGAVIDDMALACLNAVDVFVYDTTKDSDGGAWRTGALAQASSWYNETLNTANRGSRREFPAVAVIVVEANKLTIYDGDDPALPMWMVFEAANGPYAGGWWEDAPATSVAAKNAKLLIGLDGSVTETGLLEANFVSSTLGRRTSNTSYGGFGLPLVSGGQLDALPIGLTANDLIVSGYVNDVAMTVLPNAPVDPATGLPVPTIAVATDGNSTYSTSIITDIGDVYDIASDSTGTAVSVAFDGVSLSVVRSDGTVYVWDNVGSITADGASPDATYSASSTPALLGTASKVAA